MMNIIKKKIINALLEENSQLRQAVHPEDRKKIPPVIGGPVKKEKLELNKIKPIFGIACALLLIVIVFIVEISIISGKKQAQKITEEEKQAASNDEYTPDTASENYNIYGNTRGNLLNGGLAAAQGDWVYFNGDQSAVYKKNLTDNTVKMLIEENAEQLNIIGERLYYALSDTRQVYSIRTDGSDLLRIGLVSCYTMVVVSDKIYYIDFADRSLRSCDINGDNPEVLFEGSCDGFFFYKDSLYYYTFEGLFDHSGKKLIEYAYDFIPDGDFLYFIQNKQGIKSLYRYSFVNGEIEALDASAVFYNVYEDNIYYYSEEPNEKSMGIILFKNGEKKSIIYDSQLKYFNIIKDRTYYRGIDGKLYTTDIEGTSRQTAY